VRSRAEVRSVTRKAGFTLIEILVVIAVIAILASLVSPMVFRNVGDAKHTTARAQIQIFELALDAYRLDHDRYPTTEAGLEVLRTAPGEDDPRWRGPYLRRDLHLDPWGNPFIYESPGEYNPQSYDLVSLGRDGVVGGKGEDADVESWR